MLEFVSSLKEFGALGIIVGILLFFIWKHQAQMAVRLGNMEDKLMQLIENNTSAMTKLTSTLESRPCLLKEKHDT